MSDTQPESSKNGIFKEGTGGRKLSSQKGRVGTYVCETCLEWFHLDYFKLKQKPKIVDWFCNHCKSSFKKYGDLILILINEKGKFYVHCSRKV